MMTCARQQRLEKQAHALGRRRCLKSAEELGLNMCCRDEGKCSAPEVCQFFIDALKQIGVSVEDVARKLRMNDLRATPAAKRFLSLEPLLEDLGEMNLSGIDWVIAGGESGPRARPAHPDWFRSLRDQCQDAGVAFFFKQQGLWQRGDFARNAHAHYWPDGSVSHKVPANVHRAVLDGREWRQMPVQT